MFFDDIYSWSERKLKWIRILFYSIYYILATIIPVIIVGVNYKIFAKTGYKVAGFALILILIIATVGLSRGMKAIKNMAEIDKADQVKKFTIQMILALLIPVVIGWAVYMLQVNWELAAKTIRWCLLFWCFSIMVDYMFIRSLDVARDIQKKAKERIAVDKQVEALKK